MRLHPRTMPVQQAGNAIHAQGGPYPVTGMRGWVWLDSAPGIGDRTSDGSIRCQSRAMREADGIPHRCRLHASHGCEHRPCDFVPECATANEGAA